MCQSNHEQFIKLNNNFSRVGFNLEKIILEISDSYK